MAASSRAPRGRRKTVEHVASAPVETPPEPPEEPSSDRVHDEVGASFESGIEESLGGTVEPDGFRAEPPAEIELGFRSDQRQRPHSPHAGELEKRTSHASGRRGDDEPFAGARV